MSKKAVMPLTDYENACEIIREKTGTDALIKSGELTDKINKVFEQGKKTEYDRFWDTLQENGNRTSYQYAFSRVWTDDIYNPKYPITCNGANVYTSEAVFMDTTITDTKVPITISGTRMDTVFQDCLKLKRIPSLTVENIVRFSNNCFRNCRALEELNVYGTIDVNGLNLSYSPLLTKASLLTVINALKDFSTLRIYENAQDIMGNEAQWNLGLSGLAEGQTLAVDFWSFEWGGVSEEPLFDKAEQRVHTINVNGIGERLGVHYSTDYWVNPDEYTFNLMLFDDGVDESTGVPFLMVYRFLQHKETGEISDYDWGDGDRIIVYEKYAAQTCTLTLGATNLAKLTDAEKVQATEKGWTLL